MARRWLEAHGYRLPPYLQPTAAKPGAGSDEPAQPPSNAPVVDAVPVNGDDAAIDGTAMVQRLAKWIFCQRAQASNFKTLLAGARQDPQLGTFREADFLAAYRSVYATKSGRPPITGWPLQPEYKKRVGEKSPPN
jgi:hypothetical protein